MANIKKGDNVKIIAGKNRGKTGKVLRVLPEKGRMIVEGINIYKKHVRPKKQGEKGEVVNVARPINKSNISIICPACSKTTRITTRKEGNKKIRYCKKCNSPIE